MQFSCMRSVCLAAIALLSSAVVAASGAGAGAGSTPLGVVVQAAGVDRKIDLRTEGTTVYDGDTLPLGGESSLVVEIGQSRIYLEDRPSVVLHRLANGFSVTLNQGALRIYASQGEKFEVIVDGIKVANVRDTPASCKIRWVSDSRLELESLKGALLVSIGEQTATIEEGHPYRVDLLPGALAGAASAGQRPKASGKNWFTITMTTAIAVGTGIAVWLAVMSPCRP